jgi:beta-lactamase class A
MTFDDLTGTMQALAADAPAAAALYDYQTGTHWSFDGDRWFHAASTIKIAVLACLYAELGTRQWNGFHRLHVRNRFFSIADGTAYRIAPSRDANPNVHAEIGRTMRIADLARHMIETSSNLATNLLVDFAGIDRVRARLSAAGLESGIDFRRGVEDDRAFEAGVVNRVTASGLVSLLRRIYDGHFAPPDATNEMIHTLCAQQFNSGIPAGLPPPVRTVAKVAHKTGEISTVTHDAGLVFLPGRPPYVLAVLTGTADTSGRYDRIARISALAYEAVASAGAAVNPSRA